MTLTTTASTRTAGIFITHERSPRVWRHFRRLAAETTGLIDWQFALTGVEPDAPAPKPQTVLPNRFRQMRRNGTLLPGFLDVVIIPRVLALDCDYAWVIEYDVDYAGRWADFFSPFADSQADVVTSTLLHLSRCEDWVHWGTASAPAWVDRRHFHRSFHPLIRLSRRFAESYSVMMLDSDWGGHSEFTIPTAASASGGSLEHLGGEGQLTPRAHGHAQYVNTPSHPELSPGTFVWRPAREHYFHERPHAFALRDRLYHPVKPGVPAWRA